jgi:hypothetical protein
MSNFQQMNPLDYQAREEGESGPNGGLYSPARAASARQFSSNPPASAQTPEASWKMEQALELEKYISTVLNHDLSDALVKSVAMFLAGTRANPETLAIIFQTWHRRPQSSSIVLPQQHTLQQLAAKLSVHMCALGQWGKVAEILGLMPSDTALWILSAADPQWTAKILPHIKSQTVRENLGCACVAAAEKEPGAADVLPLQKIEDKSAPVVEKELPVVEKELPVAEKESGAADVLPLIKIEAKSAPVVEKRSADSPKISKKAQRPPDTQFQNSNEAFSAMSPRSGKEKVGVAPKWRCHCPFHAIPRGRPKNSVP